MAIQIDIPKKVLKEVTNSRLSADEFRIFAYIVITKKEINKEFIDSIKNKLKFSEEMILKTINKLHELELIN